MRLSTLFLSTTLVVATVSAHAMPVLNFEDTKGLVEGYSITNQYFGDFGVTFSGDNPRLVKVGAPVFGFVQNDTPNPSNAFGDYFLGTQFDNGDTDLTIDYDMAVKGLSFDMGDIDGPEEFTITAFDMGGVVLDTLFIKAGVTPGTGNRSVYNVVLEGMGIKKVTIVGASPGSPNRNLGIAFDSFQVSTMPIPLPAAFPLLAAGLGMFGALRVRKNRKA